MDDLDEAGRFLRRLLPFPSPIDAPLTQLKTAVLPQTVPSAPAAAAEQAASIVSRAASILDEEMASGVFAARATRQPSAYGDSDPANAMVRQVHDLVDNIARVFPALWNGAPQWAAPAIATPNTRNADAIATVRAPSPVRPGDSGTISMTLRNDESRPVELMPVATDLVGPTGIRISSQRLEFVPAHVRLAPGEQTDVQCRVTVPAEAAAGCYVGLLVVCGLEYLRALMSVEVTAG